MKRPDIQDLPKVTDRLTFLYLEHCRINRADGAISITNVSGTTYMPAAGISVVLLGPGTEISHRAMQLIGEAGVSVIWVGENGVRYYASGRSLNSHSNLLERQAECFCNTRKHLTVVRKMYELRFSEDVSHMNMQQLRGREGSRMRQAYKDASKRWNIPWNGRNYDAKDFESGDNVNKALSVGNACLYGLAHAVIRALGCAAGLGFVHVGRELSFVYDIADLYKAEVTIPLAFEVAALLEKDPELDLEITMRRRVRDAMVKHKILERMVRDLRWLFDEPKEVVDEQVDALYLWDPRQGQIQAHMNYAEE